MIFMWPLLVGRVHKNVSQSAKRLKFIEVSLITKINIDFVVVVVGGWQKVIRVCPCPSHHVYTISILFGPLSLPLLTNVLLSLAPKS